MKRNRSATPRDVLDVRCGPVVWVIPTTGPHTVGQPRYFLPFLPLLSFLLFLAFFATVVASFLR